MHSPLYSAKFNTIAYYLENLPLDYQVAVHNKYCDRSDKLGDYFMTREEFAEYIDTSAEPTEIEFAIAEGRLYRNDDYFGFDFYGRPIPINIDNIPEVFMTNDYVEYALEYDYDYDLEIVREILDTDDPEDPIHAKVGAMDYNDIADALGVEGR